MGLLETAQVLQQLQEIIAKLHPDESVEEGIDTAAQESHGSRHVHGVKATVVFLAVRRFLRGHPHDHVVGQLTEHEDGDHGDDDLEGFIPLEVLGLGESFDDADVTEHHNNGGNYEAQDHLTHQHAAVVVYVALAVCHARAVDVDLGEHHVGYGKDHRHDPGDQRRHLSVIHGAVAAPMGGDGFGDGEIAVDADAGEKEHAAEEADLVDGKHGLARIQTQMPSTHETGRPEGKRNGEQQVGQRQIKQIDVGHRLQPFEVKVGQDDQKVPEQSQETNGGVDGGQEPGTEVAVGVLFANEFHPAVIHICGVLVLCRGLVIVFVEGGRVGPARLKEKSSRFYLYSTLYKCYRCEASSHTFEIYIIIVRDERINIAMCIDEIKTEIRESEIGTWLLFDVV